MAVDLMTLCPKRKPEFDKYASVKSGGQFMLSAGLLADNVAELIQILNAGRDAVKNYDLFVGIIIACIVLDIIAIILSIILGTLTYPGETSPYTSNVITPSTESSSNGNPKAIQENEKAGKCPAVLKVLNNLLTVLTGVVFVLVSLKNGIRDNAYETICNRCTATPGRGFNSTLAAP